MNEAEVERKIISDRIQKSEPLIFRHVFEVVLELMEEVVEGALEERFRFAVFILVVIKHGKIIQIGGHVRMIRSQRLFVDAQGALVEWPRIGEFGFVEIKLSQVVYCAGDIRVLGP